MGRTAPISRNSSATTTEPPGRGGSRRRSGILRAWRGQFTYEDHQAPWSVVAEHRSQHRATCRSTTATPRSTAAPSRSRTICRCGRTCKAQFTHRRPARPPRSHRPRDRRRRDGRDRRRRLRALARADVPREVRACTSRGCARSSSRTRRGDWPARATSPARSGCSRAATRSERHVRQRAAGVNGYRFPALCGSLRWTPRAFDVRDAGAGFHGGDAKFTYSIKPLGQPDAPTRGSTPRCRAPTSRVHRLRGAGGLRFGGAATGGRPARVAARAVRRAPRRRGPAVDAAAGRQPMTPRSRGAPADAISRPRVGTVRAATAARALCRLAAISVRFDPDKVEFDRRPLQHRAHARDVPGPTAWGSDRGSRFTSTSRDWQESDQLLAGIMTDFGAPTGPVPFGGRGEFDGMMTGPSGAPRVEGDFKGADLRALDTLWGDGRRTSSWKTGYVNVKDGVMRARRLGDPRRRPVLARLPARGRRRGDRRADPRRRAATSTACATPSASTTTR